MNECSEIRPLLTALRDNELEPGVAATIQAHIERCSTCAQQLLTDQEVIARIQAVELFSPQIDLWPQLQHELFETPHSDLLKAIAILRADLESLRAEVAVLKAEATKSTSRAQLVGSALSFSVSSRSAMNQYRLI